MPTNTHKNIRDLFTETANAIRFKTGSTEKIKADDFPDAIDEIIVEKIGTPVPENGYMTDTQAVVGYLQGDISGAYKNSEITKVKSYAFVGHNNLTRVSFPACVTVGSYAFSGCQGLSWVSLPNVKTISYSAFQSCSSLQSITIPQCSSLGVMAFADCSALENVYIDAVKSIPRECFVRNTALSAVTFPNVTAIDYISAFAYCTSLVTVNFPKVITVGDYAFRECTSLSSIYFPFAERLNDHAFFRCYSLETVLLPAVTRVLSHCFEYCSSLKNIDFYYLSYAEQACFAHCENLLFASLPNLSAIPVDCFYSDYNLKSVYIPKCTIVYYKAFLDCSSLVEINFPSCTTLYYRCFANCITLSKVFLPNVSSLSAPNVNTHGSIFKNCYALKSIDMPKITSYITIEQHANNYELESAWYSSCQMFRKDAFYNCYKLSDVRAPRLNVIGTSTFGHCSSLSSVSFPDCTTIYSSAFTYCIELRSINFPNLASLSGVDIFLGCSKLTSVYMNKLSIIASRAFFGCELLSDLQFSLCTTIQSEAFANCSSLSNVTSAFSNVTTIQSRAFINCTSLESIYFPSLTHIHADATFNNTGIRTISTANFPLLTSIDMKSPYYGSYDLRGDGTYEGALSYGMFANCPNLEYIDLPNISYISLNQQFHVAMFGNCPKLSLLSLAGLTSIGLGTNFWTPPFYGGDYESLYIPLLSSRIYDYTFARNYRLKTIYAPKISILTSQMFFYCSSLEIIGNNYGLCGITKIQGDDNFNNCISLKIVDFPNVTTLSGTRTFNNCSSLEEVYFSNLTSASASHIFAECYNIKSVNFDSLSYFPQYFFGNNKGNIHGWIKLPGITSGAGMGTSCFGTTYLEKLELPNLSTSFNSNVFRDQQRLTQISLPLVPVIPSSAFAYCYALSNVHAPLASIIQYEAFFRCSSMGYIDETMFPNVETIENGAFSYVSLISLNFPKVKNIGYYTFQYNNITNFEYLAMPAISYIPNMPLNARKVYFNNVSTIRYNAFRDCNKIEYIECNAATKIESYAFYGCTNLQASTLAFPNVSTIDRYAFKYCNLSEIHENMFPNLTTVEHTNEIFAYNSNLSRAVFPKLKYFNNWANEFTRYIFNSNPNLKELVFNEMETATAYTSYIIGPNDNLDSINFPALKTINAEYMFASCYGLTTVCAPNLTNITKHNAFADCSSLRTISLPELVNASNATFQGCRSLEEVYLPKLENLELWNFGWCTSLKSLTLPAVTSITTHTNIDRQVFYRCTSLEYLELPAIPIWTSQVGLTFHNNENPVRLKTLSLANAHTIMGSACYSYLFLERIYVPEVTTVGDYAFTCCSSLSEIEMPKLSILSGNNQFQSCYSLKKASFPELTYTNYGFFHDCSAIEEVYMPKLERIGMYTFQWCSSLKSLTLQALNSIDYNNNGNTMAFGYGVSLDYLELPAMSSFYSQMGFDKSNPNAATVKNLSLATCTHFSNSAFYYQTELSKIYIPAAIDIGIRVFYSATISEVSIPECTRVDIEAFGQCHNLSKIYLPKVTAANAPFNNCINLHTARFDALSQIWGYNWFWNNVKMKSLYMLTDVVPSQYERYDIGSVFANSPFVNSTFFDPPEYGSIYVKESMYDAFVNNTWWKPMSDRIVALPPPYDFTI